MIERGDWQVSEIARNAYDLEGKVVGTLGSGRIGTRILQRLKPFDCAKLTYYDYQRNDTIEKETGAVRVEDLKDLVSQCDVVTVNVPLHEDTRGLINADLLKHFKKVRAYMPSVAVRIALNVRFLRVHTSSTRRVARSATQRR